MQASEPISSTSFRYISENIQFSDIILPQFSSQLFNYGYNDFISDVPMMQIDNKLNAIDESSFYMDSSLYTQQDHQLHGAQSFCSMNNYPSGPSSLMTIESLDCPSFGGNHLSTNSPNIPYNNTIKQQQPSQPQSQLPLLQKAICSSTRKHPFENSNVVKKTSPEIVVSKKTSENERTSNKKRKVCHKEQSQEYQFHKEIHREIVPVRRSQKLADKITALQKLVSPYGKTDTASVLHEASIFIKVLQDQIENMFHIPNSSSDKESPQRKIIGEKSFDLRNKELCLVPISSTRKLMEEDAFDRYCPT